LLVDSITKPFSGESHAHNQTLRFWGKTQFKVILFIICLKQNFIGAKNFGKALPLNAPPWLRAWGGPKLVNGLSKSRGIVVFLTQNIINLLFCQRHRNSSFTRDTGSRSGGTVEKFMAMEIYFQKTKKLLPICLLLFRVNVDL